MAYGTADRRRRLPANWEQLRRFVLARDGYTCQLRGPRCAGRATDVDHIEAMTDDHRPEALQAACRPCHAEKSSQEGNSVWAAMRARERHPGEKHPGLA